MRRHTERDNSVFLTVLVELIAAVALIAVYNKQIVCANSPILYMLVKVL